MAARPERAGYFVRAYRALFGRGAERPKPHGSAPDTLVEVLEEIRHEAWHECGKWSRRAGRWQHWTVVLAILGAVGSGVAGATVAASNSLTPTERAVVAILAFAGAGVAGIAAAVGAPSKAKSATLRSDRLASLDRWTAFKLVDFGKLAEVQQRQIVAEILAWRDDIFGVQAPTTLHKHSAPSGSPPPPAI